MIENTKYPGFIEWFPLFLGQYFGNKFMVAVFWNSPESCFLQFFFLYNAALKCRYIKMWDLGNLIALNFLRSPTNVKCISFIISDTFFNFNTYLPISHAKMIPNRKVINDRQFLSLSVETIPNSSSVSHSLVLCLENIFTIVDLPFYSTFHLSNLLL